METEYHSDLNATPSTWSRGTPWSELDGGRLWMEYERNEEGPGLLCLPGFRDGVRDEGLVTNLHGTAS